MRCGEVLPIELMVDWGLPGCSRGGRGRHRTEPVAPGRCPIHLAAAVDTPATVSGNMNHIQWVRFRPVSRSLVT